MAKSVTINGTTYTLSEQGDSPPWGEDLSDLLQAIIDVVNTGTGTGDILSTSFSLSNNISSATNITGLLFDPSEIRSGIINYSISRSTDSSEVSECGMMFVTYNSTSNTWELAQYGVGDAGVVFTVATTGQFKFTSDNMSGSNYAGTLRFTAKAFIQ